MNNPVGFTLGVVFGCLVMGLICYFAMSPLISQANILNYTLDGKIVLVVEGQCSYLKSTQDIYNGRNIVYEKNAIVYSKCGGN